MRSITSFAEGNFICTKGATSFICAARGGNDVLASLEMMLRALHANDVVPTAQMKKSIAAEAMDFLCYHYKIDPYKAVVQKQSMIFAVRVHLSLGDDGRST